MNVLSVDHKLLEGLKLAADEVPSQCECLPLSDGWPQSVTIRFYWFRMCLMLCWPVNMH